MGLLDEFRKLTHPYSEPEDDYDDYDDEPFEDDEPAAAPDPAPRRNPVSSFSSSRSSVTNEMPRTGGARVVNFNNGAQIQVILVRPERFDQVSEIADNLRDKRAIVLNLESTNKDVARRLVDFLSGCAYALDGKIKKIAISTYLVAPYNVEIQGDLVEDLENNAKYY